MFNGFATANIETGDATIRVHFYPWRSQPSSLNRSAVIPTKEQGTPTP